MLPALQKSVKFSIYIKFEFLFFFTFLFSKLANTIGMLHLPPVVVRPVKSKWTKFVIEEERLREGPVCIFYYIPFPDLFNCTVYQSIKMENGRIILIKKKPYQHKWPTPWHNFIITYLIYIDWPWIILYCWSSDSLLHFH